MRVHIRPSFAGPDRGEGGIRRWVEAQHKYLPDCGVEIVGEDQHPDLIVCHAGDLVRTTLPLVCHNHGLYATASQQWSRWEWQMNANVIELIRRADLTTVPSRWVADQVARGMSVPAHVLYAGIEPQDWEPGDNGGYVLWNKTRVDLVCDPDPLNRLARRVPQQKFISTFADPSLPNVQRTGRLPYHDAKMLTRNAGVYLSTSRETFGIATVEAMAAGVPVLGWRYGGNLDIVQHGQTGYLAEVGNYDDLVHGLELCVKNRAEWGANARAVALERFTWRRAIEECADLYGDILNQRAQRIKVSVIITCYKLEEYLGDCLASLQAQSMRDGWEAIVVDDCSPVTEERNCEALVAEYSAGDPRIKFTRTPHNLYLAGARNHGIAQARGEYVIPLDADDMLHPKALEVLSDFLDREPGASVAYGKFELIEPDGRRWVSTWPRPFVWEHQITHKNQLPYASMYRRWVWERTGGYRERCKTAEDADFWCRVTSYGARPVQCTDLPCLIYRNRSDSMSHVEAEPDWTAWYPWSKDRTLAPFGCVGTPPNRQASWGVKTHTEPLVSVIIPVGPGHERLVVDALDSIAAQTDDRWEAIVVNDTGEPLDLAGFPWAKIVTTGGRQGPAIARNMGIAKATAPYLAFLDADDWLMPEFIARTLPIIQKERGYVYCDWFQINKDATWERKECPEYDMTALMETGFFHAITGLYPRAAILETIGGFDPEAGGWEDWDFAFAMATAGICGTRIAEPLFCYRYWSGQRREQGVAKGKGNAATMRRKWHAYIKDGGRKLMACKGCGRGGGRKSVAASTILTPTEKIQSQAAQGDAVLIEYIGKATTTTTFRGKATGALYRFGSDSGHKIRFVYAADAEQLLARADFRTVNTAEARQTVEAARAEPLPVRQSDQRVAVG